MEIKCTQTEKNLQEAFAGESQARNKYTFFAEVAEANGHHQMAEIFLETARNEMEHAKLWFKALNGDKLPELDECLKMAAEGENYEWTTMYKDFAAKAREEGFTRVAAQMDMVAKIEKDHEDRYNALLNNLKANSVFEKEEEEVWICHKCGYRHTGKKAPMVCPLCGAQRSFFKLHRQDY